MKISDFPEDIEPRVGDILEIEQGDVCFEVRIIGITADGYLCEQDNVQGAVLLEGVDLAEDDASDIEAFLHSGGKIQQIPYKNSRKEKSASRSLASRHIGGAGREQSKGKLAGLRGRAAAVNVSGTGKAVVGEEDIEESGLQYYTGVKKHGEKYMKLAAKAGREGASQEELGRLKDRYSKAEKTKEGMAEGRFDEPLTGWHIVYRNSGNPVHATPSFETKEQAQKYLMTKMFANHQDFKVVHTAGVGVSEGSDLPPQVIEMIKKIAQSSASPEHKKAAIDALVAKYSKKGVAEGPEEHEYSLSMGNRRRPGSDRLDTDSRSRMDLLRAQEHDLKQRTIDILLKRHPDLKRSDLEAEPSLPKLIDMLRKPASEGMSEAEYQGRKVQLGKKMAGDVKKSKVYVRKPNGKVVKVNFGDKNMKIKKSNPKRRKSFRARHNCDNPGPRWKARYWSCRSW